jgi:hypothetical protein
MARRNAALLFLLDQLSETLRHFLAARRRETRLRLAKEMEELLSDLLKIADAYRQEVKNG